MCCVCLSGRRINRHFCNRSGKGISPSCGRHAGSRSKCRQWAQSCRAVTTRHCVAYHISSARLYKPAASAGCKRLSSPDDSAQLAQRGGRINAARKVCLPLKTGDLVNHKIASLYERFFVLVRPDAMVAWRGDALVDVVRGASMPTPTINSRGSKFC